MAMQPGTYMIFSLLSYKCINPYEGNTNRGSNVVVDPPNLTHSEVFEITRPEGNNWIIKEAYAGTVLDVDNANFSAGTNIKLELNNGNLQAQRWVFESLGSYNHYNKTVDKFIISPAGNTGLALDIQDASHDNGANVQLWLKQNDNLAQQWILLPVPRLSPWGYYRSKTTVPQKRSNTISGQLAHSSQTITLYFGGSSMIGNGGNNVYNADSGADVNFIQSTVTITIPPKASYGVYYNGNGGSGSVSSQTKWYNEALALQSNGFSRSGFTFKRWNTNTVDTGTGYSQGGSYTGNAALTLYAIWNRTVSYNTNGGGNAPASQTAVATSAIILAGTQTRTGYTFKCWNTNTIDTGERYSAGGTYLANSPTTTLYAIWNRTVTYNANGGNISPESQTAIASSTIPLAGAQSRDGYTQQNWNTKSDGSGTTYPLGGTYPVTTPSTTLYAMWVENPTIVSVTRVDEDGNPDDVGGYAEVVWTYPDNMVVSDYYCSVGNASTTSGDHDEETHTITAIVGDGTYIQPLASYNVIARISTSAGTSVASQTLNASTEYAKPSVSIGTIKRYALIDNEYIEDVLGTYLRSTVGYAIQETKSQTKPVSMSYSFSAVGPSNEVIDVSGFSKDGEILLTSNEFSWSMLDPRRSLANALKIVLSDKFYTTTESLDLLASDYDVPKIIEFDVERSDETGRPEDDGWALTATVNWSWFLSTYNKQRLKLRLDAYDTDGKLVASKTVDYANDTIDEYVTELKSYTIVTSDGMVAGWPGFDTDKQYSVKVTISDAWKTDIRNSVLTVAYFVIDVRAGGHGISFGAPSRGAYHNVSMAEKFFEQPDMPVVIYANKELAEASLSEDMLPCVVLCLDDYSLWYYTP